MQRQFTDKKLTAEEHIKNAGLILDFDEIASKGQLRHMRQTSPAGVKEVLALPSKVIIAGESFLRQRGRPV